MVSYEREDRVEITFCSESLYLIGQVIRAGADVGSDLADQVEVVADNRLGRDRRLCRVGVDDARGRSRIGLRGAGSQERQRNGQLQWNRRPSPDSFGRERGSLAGGGRRSGRSRQAGPTAELPRSTSDSPT